MVKLKKFYKNKRILVTGHTGFKGSWLTNCLLLFGAKVYGYSLNDDKKENYKKICNYKKVNNTFNDILNYKTLKNTIHKIKPDIIFHLAAQPLVSISYKRPYETIQTNLIGSLNLMEICRDIKNLKALILITSDKCYENIEIKRGYKETDRLGGYDPYSSSKASTEIIFNSYLKSKFFKKTGVATTRAGNVIGGGDWSDDRIIPDSIKSILNKTKLTIRNPNSTRPWQHVLEPISGYLKLAVKLVKNPKKYSGAWNFGPLTNETMNVREVVRLLFYKLGFKENLIVKKSNFKEANLLKLNSNKAYKYLNWNNKWKMRESIKQTAIWYKNFLLNKKNIKKITEKQIQVYFKDYD